MTIASEISRIQCAKSDIRQAIIDKGVSISSDLTIDDYACCIAEIPTGITGLYFAKGVIVGGGGGGSCSFYQGGGGGEVLVCNFCFEGDGPHQITIDCVGAGGSGGSRTSAGCPTCITYKGNNITARGGCASSDYVYGGASGSGCTGGKCCNGGNCGIHGGGGGGANGNGGNATCCQGGSGGGGICGYGGGGGGGVSGRRNGGSGSSGGGSGFPNTCNASNYGGGGGGGGYYMYPDTYFTGGKGCQGVVDICYRADGQCGIHVATGGNICCTTVVGGKTYCLHRFTSPGTFTIVS